jgi:hypothetical protein
LISSLHRLPDVTLPPQSVVVWRARLERVANRIALDTIVKPDWPAPGSEDTELGVLMELEVGHGETEVYAGVQA